MLLFLLKLPSNTETFMSEYIYFNSRDELLRVEAANLVYFEADGNYTRIVLANGFVGIVCMNLSKMEKMLSLSLKAKAKVFARVGKRHIVNLNYILKINALQQSLVLSDQKSFQFELNVSKDALKVLKDLYGPKKEQNSDTA